MHISEIFNELQLLAFPDPANFATIHDQLAYFTNLNSRLTNINDFIYADKVKLPNERSDIDYQIVESAISDFMMQLTFFLNFAKAGENLQVTSDVYREALSLYNIMNQLCHELEFKLAYFPTKPFNLYSHLAQSSNYFLCNENVAEEFNSMLQHGLSPADHIYSPDWTLAQEFHLDPIVCLFAKAAGGEKLKDELEKIDRIRFMLARFNCSNTDHINNAIVLGYILGNNNRNYTSIAKILMKQFNAVPDRVSQIKYALYAQDTDFALSVLTDYINEKASMALDPSSLPSLDVEMNTSSEMSEFTIEFDATNTDYFSSSSTADMMFTFNKQGEFTFNYAETHKIDPLMNLLSLALKLGHFHVAETIFNHILSIDPKQFANAAARLSEVTYILSIVYHAHLSYPQAASILTYRLSKLESHSFIDQLESALLSHKAFKADVINFVLIRDVFTFVRNCKVHHSIHHPGISSLVLDDFTIRMINSIKFAAPAVPHSTSTVTTSRNEGDEPESKQLRRSL